MRTLCLIITLLCPFLLTGQITQPGISGTNMATWAGVAVKHHLNKEQYLSTYLGTSRMSKPDSYNPFQRPAISIINPEFYHRFHEHWGYSFALSLRQQSIFRRTEPFDRSDPPFFREGRIYGRYAYFTNLGKLALSLTFRQEWRTFYNPDLSKRNRRNQLRSRLKAKVTIPLDAYKKHRLIASSEFLFLTNRQIQPEISWTPFGYNDTRLCLFYAFSPRESYSLEFGYMNHLIGAPKPYPVSSFAFNLVFTTGTKNKSD